MITVSLCMIVKNEEDALPKCLRSVSELVDEIVIVDTGSTDRTKEIASQFTDKIYDFAWIDDFSAARNFSYDHATKEYILWLDADDVIWPEDAEKFKKLKENLPPMFDVVMMKYNTGFDAHGKVTFSYYRERLCRAGRHFRWREPVHEYLDAAGKRLTTDICITHAKPHGRAGGRNLHIYENLLSAGKELSPRGMYYYARELKDHGRFADAIQWFEQFLDTKRGWVEDCITACGDLALCYGAEDQPDKVLASLLRSFGYDMPRAEICCQIGYYFKELSQFKQAAFWFGLILTLEARDTQWGFHKADCWGFIPCIELAVCYDALGDVETAASYNEKAAAYKPDSPAVLHNKQYFSSRMAYKASLSPNTKEFCAQQNI